MRYGFTRADLEAMIILQWEKLVIMQQQISVVKQQNEWLHTTNKKLKDEISTLKQKKKP